MATITKQRILDDLKELTKINEELTKSLKKLEKIYPTTFNEEKIKNNLEKTMKNQKTINQALQHLLKLYYVGWM